MRSIRVLLAVLLVGAVSSGAAGAAEDTPTFAKDVAPILYDNCVVCHREGEVAPMALTTYAAARPWARAIND